MSKEIKESIEALRQTTHDLAVALKANSENRSKIDNIVEDLQKKQAEYETRSQERKGVFAGDTGGGGSGYFTWDSKNLNGIIQSDVKGDDKIEYLRRKNDDILIVSQVLGIDPKDTKTYKEFVTNDPIMKKDMYSTGSGVGDEWVPTGYSADLYDKIRLALKVANLHPSINMPTNPYVPPLLTGDMTGYLVSERTGADDTLTSAYRFPASTPTSSNFTLTAKKLAGRVVFSEELSEDSIIPIMPLVRRNIVIAIATAIEKAIIDGDTSATHQDGDVTGSSTDARCAWDGYRKLTNSSAKVSLATLTGEAILNVRKAMGKYGVNAADLSLVTGISGYIQLLSLKDSGSNQLVTTLDKYGSSATILNGELGRVYGMPIIVSEHVRENLNASGVYDATTTTKTIMLLVNRSGFLIGNRRGLTIKSAEDITTDQTVLVATQRLAFAEVYSGATDNIVGLGYNITS